jgi:hypothetical protein
MKKIIVASILALVLAISGTAMAIPTTWEVTENYAPPYYINVMNGKLLYLDLRDDGYVPGMEINDFTLTINVSDGIDCRWLPSEYIILAAGTASNGTWSVGDLSVGWSLLGEWDIEDDGTLNFLVLSKLGDFYLNSAKLLATGDDGTHFPEPSQVPEPATMLLFGFGLLGIAGIRRKMK